jgi:hypothetical protein
MSAEAGEAMGDGASVGESAGDASAMFGKGEMQRGGVSATAGITFCVRKRITDTSELCNLDAAGYSWSALEALRFLPSTRAVISFRRAENSATCSETRRRKEMAVAVGKTAGEENGRR